MREEHAAPTAKKRRADFCATRSKQMREEHAAPHAENATSRLCAARSKRMREEHAAPHAENATSHLCAARSKRIREEQVAPHSERTDLGTRRVPPQLNTRLPLPCPKRGLGSDIRRHRAQRNGSCGVKDSTRLSLLGIVHFRYLYGGSHRSPVFL